MSQKSRKAVLPGCVPVAALIVGYSLREFIAIPGHSGISQANIFIPTLLMAWPILLIITWLFSMRESKRKKTFDSICPSLFVSNGSVSLGEIQPFFRDWFYHIFQFFWIIFVIIATLIFSEVQALSETISNSWAETPDAIQNLETLGAFIGLEPPGALLTEQARPADSLTPWVDTLLLTCAFLFALFSLMNQRSIQRVRETNNINMYWWDRRISPLTSYVRQAMVGLDVFLGVYLLLKILLIAATVYFVVSSPYLQIKYFSADQVGGLAEIANLYKKISWMAFALGLFVIASMYLHRNLPEYRGTDSAALYTYLVLVFFVMWPLFELESRLGEARSAIAYALDATQRNAVRSFLSLGPTSELQYLNEFKNWSVSAVSSSLFDNPAFALGSQFLIIAYQWMDRAAGGLFPSNSDKRRAL